MRLPFIHRDEIGIFFGEKSITWVELRAFGGRVRRLTMASEIVDTDSESGRQDALALIVDRRKASGRAVSFSIDQRLCRFTVIDAPEFDDPSDATEWLDDQGYRLLGAGLSREQLVLRHTTLTSVTGRARHLIACTRAEAVENMHALVAGAGLVPKACFMPAALLGNAFVFDGDFLETDSWILATVQPSILSRYREGRLENLAQLIKHPANDDDVKVEMQSLASDVVDSPRLYRLDAEGAIERENVDASRKEAAAATAVATTSLFAGLDRIDFIDSDQGKAAQSVQDRREAVAFMVPAVILVFLLLAVATGLQIWLSQSLAEARAAEAEIAPVLVELKEEARLVATLQARIDRSRKGVEERSRAALVLEYIGRTVPEGLTLRQLSVERREEAGPDEQWMLVIKGEADVPSRVTRFLAKLEGEQLFGEPRLLHSVRKGKIDDAAAVSFEIVSSAAPWQTNIGHEGGAE